MVTEDLSKQMNSRLPMLKIGIVEDEIIIAENIVNSLESLGYEVIEPANTYAEAIGMLTKHKPDLVLLDIVLNDTLDGIQLAERINSEFHVPFIFLTANADIMTVNRAKQTEPAAFLVKPFTRDELYASIEVAATKSKNYGQNKGLAGAIFVKDGSVLRKLYLHDIEYITSERVYISVKTKHRIYVLRKSLAQMLDEMSDPRFLQVHRSHIVNTHHVTQLEADTLTIGSMVIPITKTQRLILCSMLRSPSVAPDLPAVD